MSPTTIAGALGVWLARQRSRAYGAPLAGCPVVALDDDGQARLLAQADAWLHDGPAVVVTAGRRVEIAFPDRSSAAPSPPVEITDGGALVDVLTALGAGETDAVCLVLDADPGAPAPTPPPPPLPARWVTPPPEIVERIRDAGAPVLVAGGGVIRDGAIPGLHAFAAAAQLGVLNSFDAKGVFDWRSRHHLATAGLQRDDLARAAVAEADLALRCGVHRAAFPEDPLLGDAVEIAPGMLDPLAELCHRPHRPIPMPPLRDELAALTQAAWTLDGAPLLPSRVTRSYAQALPPSTLTLGEPGYAGFFLARTFATVELGSARVPITAMPAFSALAAAIVARLDDPNRPVLAVLDAPVDAAGMELAERLVELARRLGVSFAAEAWSASEGEALDAPGHQAWLAGALTGGAPVIHTLRVAGSQLAGFTDVAGPISAWPVAARPGWPAPTTTTATETAATNDLGTGRRATEDGR